MNKDDPQSFILEKLDFDHKVMVIDLAQFLNVTPETIRRDLTEMEMNEQLTRIHGGAVAFIRFIRKWSTRKKCSYILRKRKK